MSQLHFPACIPTLQADGLFLRELREEDIPGWFERATDASAADLAGDPIPASLEMGLSWLRKHREQFRHRAGLRWAIVPSGCADSIGTVGLTFSVVGDAMADLGIVIARAEWGRGLGTAAACRVIDFAFGQIGLQEIRAEVLERNAASIRMLEKAGFRLLRRLAPSVAEPEPMLLFSCVATDPPPGR